MRGGRARRVSEESLTAWNRDANRDRAASWYVYLFALADCSAFKVGFSHSPLQRIYTFSHRYFERFDLFQSLILQVEQEIDARAAEAALKAAFGEFRADCPTWIPIEAGGHTEWFSAVHFVDAERQLSALLRTNDVAQLSNAFELLRGELARASSDFEIWARSQLRSASCDPASVLRDWLDAYHYMDIPLFPDDRPTAEALMQLRRMRPALR